MSFVILYSLSFTYENDDDVSTSKKACVVWSVRLHKLFVSVVNQLGLDKVVPKRILELTNANWLHTVTTAAGQAANFAKLDTNTFYNNIFGMFAEAYSYCVRSQIEMALGRRGADGRIPVRTLDRGASSSAAAAEPTGYPGGPYDTSLLVKYEHHVARHIWFGEEREPKKELKVAGHGLKLTSRVLLALPPQMESWEFFTMIEGLDNEGRQRAKCNARGTSYAYGGKRHGTNSLKRHLEVCKKVNFGDIGQMMLDMQGKLRSLKVDSLVSREMCARLIIK
ncbi:hypothetical protein KIW84_071396 [Lathyrus oleraceus]|uniref:Uncharacterized protein n=1 Tax=Pisum sativum TaxID=3888 RepID=A0A9D4VK35_PEA|nr:hypothetical protein KIW84_071396 [Pisum sativum]